MRPLVPQSHPTYFRRVDQLETPRDTSIRVGQSRRRVSCRGGSFSRGDQGSDSGLGVSRLRELCISTADFITITNRRQSKGD